MKKVLITLAAVILLANLSACETMKGTGKDVEDAGEGVQEKAN